VIGGELALGTNVLSEDDCDDAVSAAHTGTCAAVSENKRSLSGLCLSNLNCNCSSRRGKARTEKGTKGE
jgi:hypothetical protein